MKPKLAATRIIICLLCAAFLFVSGCNDDSSPTEPIDENPDIVYSDSTVVIDTTKVSEPIIEGDDYTYTFTGDPPDIIEGDIILGQTGGGYLRRVTGVTIQGNQMILETVQATLTEAFEELEVQGNFSLSISDSSVTGSIDNALGLGETYYLDGVSGADGGLNLNNVELFDAVVSQGGRSIELCVSISDGRIEYEPDVDIGLEIHWFTLEEFHAIAESELVCDMELECTASAALNLLEGHRTIFSHRFGAIPIGPLVFVPTLRFIAGYNVAISAAGSFSTGFNFESSTTIGTEYDGSEWSSVYEHEAELARGPVRWDASFGASITGYVKPRLSFELYAVAGPYMEIEPYLRFGGVVRLRDWEWGLYAGIDANVGVSMDIMGHNLADYHLNLQNWEREIAVQHGEFPNDPPSTPSAPNPSNGATNQPIDTELRWQCSDPDADQLTFDIYFGTSQNPSLAREGWYALNYDPGDLDRDETYYWKIVAHDEFDHTTAGPVWRFTTEPPENRAPAQPSNPSPAHQATNQSTDTNLSWSCSDPDSDPLTYDVYFGTAANPPRVRQGISPTSFDPGNLNTNTTYYWKIIARDDNAHSTVGPIWRFTTAPPGNQPPNAPSNPSPAHQAANQSTDTNLSWSCSDPDGDPITFDVYFGTSEDPPLVCEDQEERTYQPDEMEYELTYYWKIVAKDDQAHITEGSVWHFTTAAPDNQSPNAPSNPSPPDEADNQDINTALSWDCSDPENDPLAYDVYFGDSENPPLVSENQAEDTYEPGELEFEQTYYWKIFAKDNQDHTTEGSVWSFTTRQEGGDVEEREFELANGVTITMVWIPPGSFMMGRQDGEQDSEDNEDPRHEVNINYGFWMGKYEVTQAQWEAVTGNNPSRFNGDNRPVERVSWNDIHEGFLSQIDDDFRLPSESEWEYACRAGTETRFYWGDDPDYDEIGDYAWYTSNSNSQTHDVGQKRPNTFGLYDMSGNVWEWCEDVWHGNYNGAPADGSDWTQGGAQHYRVLRSGSWSDNPWHCRSALRSRNSPSHRTSSYGFRLVLVRQFCSPCSVYWFSVRVQAALVSCTHCFSN